MRRESLLLHNLCRNFSLAYPVLLSSSFRIRTSEQPSSLIPFTAIMVNLIFLAPETFNVLKYVVLSLSVSLGSDVLLHTIQAYSSSRKLLKTGYVHPVNTPVRVRTRRGIKLVSFRERWVLVTVLIAVSLEIALELSTGATTIWTTRSDTFRMSMQASNISQVYQGSQEYIKRMRSALERVEGTCYNIQEEWYSPVTFNMTNSSTFFATGRAAWCLQNYTNKINATEDLNQSTFWASDVVKMKFWNASQLRVGRSAESSELSVPYEQVGDVRIGAREKYSFLAVNFTNKGLLESSVRVLTGNSTHDNPRAFFTANYSTGGDLTFECLGEADFFNKDTGEAWPIIKPWIEACLVPIEEDRMVLALFDDYDGIPRAFQLVMLAALEDVKSFHDLSTLRAIPWMVGSNKGRHTYRELGALAVLCHHMITGICSPGFRDVTAEFGDENATVPTWSVWGMVLLGVGVVLIGVLNVVVSRERTKLKVWGNLATANGVAEHWLRQKEHFDDVGGKGRVVLVAGNSMRGNWATVAVRRED